MTRKFYFFIVTLIFTLTFCLSVDARGRQKCSTKDLETLDIHASSVKVSYDLVDNSLKKTITEDKVSRNYILPDFDFKISIYNITSDIYVKISNDVDDKTVTVKNSDATNNIYSFINKNYTEVYTYTFDIYSNNSTCDEMKLKTLTLTKPRYNVYSETDYCQTSNAKFCNRFVTTKEMTYDDFLERIAANTEEPEVKQSKVQEFLINNGKRLAAVVVLIILVVVLTVVVKRNIDDNKMKKGGWKI